MNDDGKKKRAEEVALFRYGLIADLVQLPRGHRGIYQQITEKAERDYAIPGSARMRVAPETIRDWLKDYRRGGFDALVPRPRKDAGQSRLPRDVSDLLVSVKEENRALTAYQVIDKVRAEYASVLPPDLRIAPATVYRLFERQGLGKKAQATPNGGKDHRRFAFQKAGDLWMSDVMHGPTVAVEGKGRRKAYLIGFLDDATRVVPYCAFALAENTTCFLPVLKQAVLRRGIPKRLFVDNGAHYRSHHLAIVCAKLGISLIHARPYHPEAKGKQERWFRTARIQLLPLLTPSDTQSLDALNRRLWAYVEGEYHRAPHRGLDGETPLDRWAKTADEVKHVGPDVDLDDLFLFESKRKVHKDRTVSLDGVVYEVDASLVGETVTLRYDPSRRGRPVQVWARGRKIQDAKVVDAYANCFVRRDRPTQMISTDGGKPPPQSKLRLSAIRRDGNEEEGR